MGDRPKDRDQESRRRLLQSRHSHLELFPDNEEARPTMPIHVQADKYYPVPAVDAEEMASVCFQDRMGDQSEVPLPGRAQRQFL